MPKIKFSDEQVREIRKNRYGLTDKQQAEKYNCHRNSIWQIRNGLQRAGVK